MSPTDQLLLLLHSAAWAEHKIGSAYEAAFDIILTPQDEFPDTIDELCERWHVYRGTARKYLRNAQQLLIDALLTEPGTETEKENNAEADHHAESHGEDLHHEGPYGEDLHHKASRVNINALSNDKAAKRVKRARERFVRPTPDEVDAYLRKIGESRFDGQVFCNYYDSCGWVVGRDCKPMKNWRAAVHTWQRNRNASSYSPHTSNTSSNPPHHYATSTTPHRYPSDRAAERAERQQQFAQHIQRLLDDPGAEQQPTLDF